MAELRPSKRAREDDTGGVSETEEQSSRRAPVVVFAHGAGGNSSHEWMVRWKELLASATNAVEVVTFDYPYCANGKRGPPPKAEKLVDSHIAEIEKAVEKHSGHPLVLIGKSMGSRVSCMVAGKKDTKVAAVVCLGYPLKGSKDNMCPLNELEKVRKKMTVKNDLHVVEGGDHSLKQSKRVDGMTQDDAERSALDHIQRFLVEVLDDVP
ncbi:hypothetical protein BDL97_13G104200 [Sphagnum fallax]|nr:hypothetical protein BDL97_13G104200 [Sphagnum fallax]KAH8944316.1 hypothetical protein BDL97_13G104200 [Sphagnum fallax]